jgi:Holliday junction resolvase RusA-like endonuclease
MISFNIPMVPPRATSQTKRLVMVAGKPRFFHKKKHATAEGDLLTLCAQYAPSEPMKGPIRLLIAFRFPWRKGETKGRILAGWAWNDKRPDLDNQAKLVCDVLCKLGFFQDDGQIASLVLEKLWSDKVGINIKMHSLK